MKREFLQQCQPYKEGKHNLIGWMASEKLDGQRCFWDGGISRGTMCSQVPWANNDKKSSDRMATGLWTRYGNPIFAPEWFLNGLPSFPIDGELWTGYRQWSKLRKIISTDIPDSNRWKDVIFCAFNAPVANQVLFDGEINLTNFSKTIIGCEEFISRRGGSIEKHRTNWEGHKFLLDNLIEHDNLLVHPQRFMSTQEDLDTFLSDVLAKTGEGLVAIHPTAIYSCSRHRHSVKIKPYQDSEAVVVGYVSGRETDKGSKLLGLMGALIVDWKGKRFELSGFTNEERVITHTTGSGSSIPYNWACANPETHLPSHYHCAAFPRGSVVTFKFREISDAGVPKEASYLRPFEGV